MASVPQASDMDLARAPWREATDRAWGRLFYPNGWRWRIKSQRDTVKWGPARKTRARFVWPSRGCSFRSPGSHHQGPQSHPQGRRLQGQSEGLCLWDRVENIRGLLVIVCERPPGILEATGSPGGGERKGCGPGAWNEEQRTGKHSLRDFIITVHMSLSIIVNCRIQRNLGCIWVWESWVIELSRKVY